MLAQVGLDAAAAGLFAPIILLWLIAAGYLTLLVLFGILVHCVRAWHLWREADQRQNLD